MTVSAGLAQSHFPLGAVDWSQCTESETTDSSMSRDADLRLDLSTGLPFL